MNCRSPFSCPQILWILVVSIASSKPMGGRIDGMRLAIIDLPEPGGQSLADCAIPLQPLRRLFGRGIGPSLRKNRIRLGFGERSRVERARRLTLSRPARIVRPQRDWALHKRTIHLP